MRTAARHGGRILRRLVPARRLRAGAGGPIRVAGVQVPSDGREAGSVEARHRPGDDAPGGRDTRRILPAKGSNRDRRVLDRRLRAGMLPVDDTGPLSGRRRRRGA